MSGPDTRPGTGDAASPRVERRTDGRHRCRKTGPRLTIAQRHESQTVQARDVSATGIGLLVSRWLKPGTLALLSLQEHPGSQPLVLLAEVVHATVQPDWRWLIGCKYDNTRGDLSEVERLQLVELLREKSDRPVNSDGRETLPDGLVQKLSIPLPRPSRVTTRQEPPSAPSPRWPRQCV